MVGIILLKNTQETFAAGDINAPTRTIIENIIGISGAVEVRHDLTRVCIENDQFCGFSKADEQPMMRFVECHWKISCSASSGPRRARRPFFPVNDSYLLSCGNIHEDARSRLL